MTVVSFVYLVAVVLAGWESFRAHSPGWAGVALIALGLALTEM